MDDQTMLTAIDDTAAEPDMNDASPECALAVDESVETTDTVEETPEEAAAREHVCNLLKKGGEN